MTYLDEQAKTYIYLYELVNSQETIDEKYPPKNIILKEITNNIKELISEIKGDENKCNEILRLKNNKYVSKETIENAEKDLDCLQSLRWELEDIIYY